MRRDRPEHGRRPPLRPRLRGQRISGVGRHPEQRRELRQHGAQQLDVGPYRPAGSGRGPGRAPPRARPAAAGPAPGAPDGPRRTPDRGGTVELAGHEPAVASGRQRPELDRPAPSCRPLARRPRAGHDSGRRARPRRPPAAPPPHGRAQRAATAAAAAAEGHARRGGWAPSRPRRPARARGRERAPSAVWYRLSGSFSSRRSTICEKTAGTDGFSVAGGVGTRAR